MLPFPFLSFLMTLYVHVLLRKSQNNKTREVMMWVFREDWKMGFLVLCSEANRATWIFLFKLDFTVSNAFGKPREEADRLVRDQRDKSIEEKI